MHDPLRLQWPDHEVRAVELELKIEYPKVSAAAIQRVVAATVATVDPNDGWVRLLATARRLVIP